MSGNGWQSELGPYVWIPSADGYVPPKAVVAGKDTDGATLFAGRAFHDGHLLPAKISPTQSRAFVAHDGGEHNKDEYEVLCCFCDVDWLPSTVNHREIPSNAIVVGSASDGEKLYMGRAKHQGSLTPGKIHPSEGSLRIPFDGKEVKCNEFEVLVLM